MTVDDPIRYSAARIEECHMYYDDGSADDVYAYADAWADDVGVLP